jgi:hypothetical protein
LGGGGPSSGAWSWIVTMYNKIGEFYGLLVRPSPTCKGSAVPLSAICYYTHVRLLVPHVRALRSHCRQFAIVHMATSPSPTYKHYLAPLTSVGSKVTARGPWLDKNALCGYSWDWAGERWQKWGVFERWWELSNGSSNRATS